MLCEGEGASWKSLLWFNPGGENKSQLPLTCQPRVVAGEAGVEAEGWQPPHLPQWNCQGQSEHALCPDGGEKWDTDWEGGERVQMARFLCFCSDAWRFAHFLAFSSSVHGKWWGLGTDTCPHTPTHFYAFFWAARSCWQPRPCTEPSLHGCYRFLLLTQGTALGVLEVRLLRWEETPSELVLGHCCVHLQGLPPVSHGQSLNSCCQSTAVWVPWHQLWPLHVGPALLQAKIPGRGKHDVMQKCLCPCIAHVPGSWGGLYGLILGSRGRDAKRHYQNVSSQKIGEV